MKDFLTPKIIKLIGNFAIITKLARQKCVLQAVFAMSKTRQVQLRELAYELNDDAKLDSNERRLQNFFRHADCSIFLPKIRQK